jgi:hypothetical protein
VLSPVGTVRVEIIHLGRRAFMHTTSVLRSSAATAAVRMAR